MAEWLALLCAFWGSLLFTKVGIIVDQGLPTMSLLLLQDVVLTQLLSLPVAFMGPGMTFP